MYEPELEWSTNHQPSVRRPMFAWWRDTAASSAMTSGPCVAADPHRFVRVEALVAVAGADQQTINGTIRPGVTIAVDVGALLIGEQDRVSSSGGPSAEA